MNIENFPAQRLPKSKKTDKWAIECVKAVSKAVDNKYTERSSLRQSKHNKITNYNLYNNILDPKDMQRLSNPFGVPGYSSPTQPQNHPIANTKIDLLLGEYSKRKFPWVLRVGDYDAISEKEKRAIANIKAEMQKLINEEASKEEVNMRLEEIKKDNATFQEKREIAGNRILQHEIKKIKFDDKIADGFADWLLVAEAGFYIDIVGTSKFKEIIFEKINPLNIYTYGQGESPWFHDADIIVLEQWKSKGQIQDLYWDVLDKNEIDSLDNGGRTDKDGYWGEGHPSNITIPDHWVSSGDRYSLEDIANSDSMIFDGTSLYEKDGNIRVLKVFWKSQRKMKIVSFFNPETGSKEDKLEDEQYQINTSEGEEEKIIWVQEWMQGDQIGRDLFKRVGVRPVQMRDLSNPSKCRPPIVGGVMNVNSSKAMSLMDRMKPYIYIYNAVAERTINAVSLNYGKLMKLSIQDIPDNWKLSKWLHYVQTHKLWIYDPFKEGKKGVATGKLAGNMNQTSPLVDMELGSFIEYHIRLMEYIENQLGQIAGIPPQREASVSASEQVGNVERVLTQSSHITEKWFALYDRIKLEALRCLLETTKIIYKDKPNFKAQAVLGSGDTEILNMESSLMPETYFDIHISTVEDEAELMRVLKNQTQALLQNDKADIEDLITLYTSPSIANISQRMREKQKMRQNMAAQNFEATNKAEMEKTMAPINADIEQKMKELKFKYTELETNSKLEAAKIENSDVKNMNDLKTTLKDLEIKMQSLQEDIRSNKANEKINSKNSKDKT